MRTEQEVLCKELEFNDRYLLERLMTARINVSIYEMNGFTDTTQKLLKSTIDELLERYDIWQFGIRPFCLNYFIYSFQFGCKWVLGHESKPLVTIQNP
jgi:hypothetical protein